MDDLDHSMHISDHDWVSFFEDSEECCLLQPSLASPDSPGLSDEEDLDFKTHTYTPLNDQQAGAESKEPQAVEEKVSSVACFAEDESQGGQEPVDSDPKLETEQPAMKGALSSGEKERWFVTVNDNPPPHQGHASGAVVKKNKKQKKVWKGGHKDGKKKTCHELNTIKKVLDEQISDTNTESLETEVNETCHKDLCAEGSLHHLDIGSSRRKQTQKVICADINKLLSPNAETIPQVCSENPSVELNVDLACLGVSYRDSTLHFAKENKTEATDETKCDTDIDRTKSTETSGTAFIQGENVGHEFYQTKATMTWTEGSSTKDHLDNSKSTKSTCFESDITNQADLEHTEKVKAERKPKEQNREIICLENSGQESTVDNTKNCTICETNTTNCSSELGAIHRKCLENASDSSEQEDVRSFGHSCHMDTLNLASEQYAESTMNIAKPADNHISNANSIESDEFADVEFFSSSSYDSETYQIAAESLEDPWHLAVQNSPCDLSTSVNDDSLADRGMHSCLQCDSNQSYIETSQIFPSAYPCAENTLNDKSTCSDGTKGTVHDTSVDTPPSAGNSSSFSEGHSEALLQPNVSMESPEAYAKATGNNEPVYAISSFWDEMEKLTINDILQIRMGRCMLPVEEAPNSNDLVSSSFDITIPSTIMPESTILDTLDAADSDYCTNLDESKPDHSSCDFSTSDFEEEYLQFINSSRNSSPDFLDKDNQSQCMDYDLTGEEESDDLGTPVPSEDSSWQKWSCESTFSSHDITVPHQMRKTKSMYDIQALKTMDLSSQAFLDQSSSMFLEEHLNMSDGFEIITPVMCHTDEQYQISFPKVVEYLFDDNEAKCEAMCVNFYGLQGNPAINNYTFSTAINDLPLRPFSEEPIPIFSCSHPTVRELTFSKPSCVFLGTNYTAMKDLSPIQMISRSILRSMDYKQTDRAFCFSQDLSNLYSVKTICFFDQGSDLWRHQSENEKNPVDTVDSSITMVGEREVFTTSPMFKKEALRQIMMENNQIPSDYQSIFSRIKQSDMCLVCIAFASWVLRSSDPEAADAWKAALLANVSALSAIQYLRQYMKKKTSPQDD